MPNTNSKQYEKYTKEELRKALLFVDGAFDTLESVFDIIKDPKLIEKARRVIDDKSIPEEDIFYIVEEFYDEIAKHMDKKDFKELNTIESNTHQMVEIILRHPEYYEGGLGKEDILTLLSVERHNPRALYSWSYLPIGQMLLALDYSKEEQQAVREYAGIDDYSIEEHPEAYVEFVYETYNMLFFPGLENEASRLYEEARTVHPEVIESADQFLDFSRNLYKALYKSSRKLPDGLEVHRVDRVATVEAMEETGEVMSNFSTTLAGEFGDFGKTHTALETGYVHKGVVAGEFSEILKKEYDFDIEEELLITPGTKVTMEDEEVTEYDQRKVTGSWNNVERKLYMEFFADNGFVDPLSSTEKRKMSDLRAFITNPENTKKAGEFLRQITKARNHNVKDGIILDPTITFDEAVANMDPEIVKAYKDYKAAFVGYYKYMTREVVMEVESSLKRAYENYKEKRVETKEMLWKYGVNHPQTKRFTREGIELRDEAEEPREHISREEFEELIRLERNEQISQAVDTFAKVVGENDLQKSEADLEDK